MDNFAPIAVFATVITLIGAWVTHIVASLMAGKYLLLIAGAIFFPIGMIHGIGIWFGVNW